MNGYWLDSDVLVFAKDQLAPIGYPAYSGFWTVMDASIKNGVVRITKRNYQEIVEGRDREDELARWLRLRRGPNVCVVPTREVQEFAADIGNYVFSNPRYYQRHCLRFAKGADAWLIAQAAVDRGVVVTREVSQPDSHDPKIPDLCHEFGVDVKSLIDLMKLLGK
jgi:hypothetical protein